MYIGKHLRILARAMGRAVYGRNRGAMPNVFEYTDHKKFFNDIYLAKKKVDPNFSHRYVCQKLGARSTAAFRHCITGERAINDDTLTRLISIFKLGRREGDYLELLVRFNQARGNENKRDRLAELSGFLYANRNLIKPHQYAYYEKWYHSAIRALFTYTDFDGDTVELAEMLQPPITSVQARNSIRMMSDLGIIAKGRSGFLRPTNKNITTGDQASHVALGGMVLQTFELAKGAMDKVPRDRRELSTLTLSISEGTYETIRREIAKCRYRILEAVSKDEKPDRVYQVGFQAFPLTKIKTSA